MNNKTLGSKGEDIAALYLKRKGYEILSRNYRQKFGEIDIICRSKTRTLIFVEVKTLLKGESNVFKPEDNLTQQKYNYVKRMAEFFIGKYPQTVSEEAGWQIDLIAVEIFESDGSFVIRHYENI